MNTFKSEMEIRRDIEREDKLEQENLAALHFFFSVHREFLDCMASRKAILNYFDGSPLTVQNLEDAIAVDSSLCKMLPRQTEQDDRQALEQAIVALLAGGNSHEAVKHEASKFRFKSVEELAAWHD